MLQRLGLLAGLFVYGFSCESQPARADTISYQFSGTFLPCCDPSLGGQTFGIPGISPGDSFAGQFSYESNSAPISLNQTVAEYSIDSFIVTSNGYSFAASNPLLEINIDSTETDFGVFSQVAGTSSPQLYMALVMRARGSPGSPLENLRPPVDLDLGDWVYRNIAINDTGSTLFPLGGSTVNLDGRIQSLTVPEPSSLMLLCCGMLAFWGSRLIKR